MQPRTSIRNSSRTNETEIETGICASLKFEFISVICARRRHCGAHAIDSFLLSSAHRTHVER